MSSKTCWKPAQQVLHLSNRCPQQQRTQSTLSNRISYNRHQRLPHIWSQNTSTGQRKIIAINEKRFIRLYCHCGRPVHWQRGWALYGKAGDKQRRHKVYQQKIHCCHCRRRFNFTLNTQQTDNTWCPFQRACPLCKAAFHSAACMPAPKSIVSVH